MALTDRFRKFTQDRSVQVKQDSCSRPEHLNPAREAALEFLSILQFRLAAVDGRLHAGTVLSAAAWLTGTSLYRSFQFQEGSQPGTIIQSDVVNQEWESLVYLLEQYNFQNTDIPVGRLVLAAMAAPAFFKPEVGMFHVQRELQGRYNVVMKKYGFDYLDGARVGIMLCSILIQRYSAARLIDADAAAGLVAQGIFEAAKSVPPSLD